MKKIILSILLVASFTSCVEEYELDDVRTCIEILEVKENVDTSEIEIKYKYTNPKYLENQTFYEFTVNPISKEATSTAIIT